MCYCFVIHGPPFSSIRQLEAAPSPRTTYQHNNVRRTVHTQAALRIIPFYVFGFRTERTSKRPFQNAWHGSDFLTELTLKMCSRSVRLLLPETVLHPASCRILRMPRTLVHVTCISSGRWIFYHVFFRLKGHVLSETNGRTSIILD